VEKPSKMTSNHHVDYCKEKMPEDMEVVIAMYLGRWPGRGNSGIADVYAVDGKWFNLPEISRRNLRFEVDSRGRNRKFLFKCPR
jgi:hypothetical protein